jgi:hypothetical protein
VMNLLFMNLYVTTLGELIVHESLCHNTYEFIVHESLCHNTW